MLITQDLIRRYQFLNADWTVNGDWIHTGNITITKVPVGGGANSSLVINPASAVSGHLLWLGVNDVIKFNVNYLGNINAPHLALTNSSNQIVLNFGAFRTTTLSSGSVGSPITITFPVKTTTLGGLNLSNTWSAVNTFSNQIDTQKLKVIGNLGFYNTVPQAQSTGWNVTNVTPDKGYDANATTVAELADVLGTLINDLKTYGLIGA